MWEFLDYAMIESDGRKPSVTVYHFDGPSVNILRKRGAATTEKILYVNQFNKNARKGVIEMSRYLKKSIEKVNSNAESYVDLSDFKEAAPDKQRTGCMSVVCTSGSKRLKLNHDLYAALNEPSSVRVLLGKSKIAIVAVPDGTTGSFKLGKGGILYDTAVVDEVISLTSGIDFPENASTRCGTLTQVQDDGKGNLAAIVTL